MNSQKLIFTLPIFFLLFLISALSGFGQVEQGKQAEPNYEATLHVLVGSSQSGQGDALPSSMSAVARQIRGEFGVTGLRLITTYLGRMSNQGTLEYKGISKAFSPEMLPGSPSFLDWQLVGLKPSQDDKGPDIYQFQSFRFGARIPVRVGVFQDEKSPAPINYEAIGLTLSRLNVRESVPSLVGTLTQPQTDGTLFLVLTVKNVDK